MRALPTTHLKQWITTTAIVAFVLVAGCKTDQIKTGSVAVKNLTETTTATPQAGARMLVDAGARYKRNPSDKRAALEFASLLGKLGREDQALAVMRKLVIFLPEDREVLAEYGKALAQTGELPNALDAVRRAQTPEYPDWRLMASEAAILDQMGKPDEAQILYTRALELQPEEASIYSNIGMSHLMRGDILKAEAALQRAARGRNADDRIKQNLALVVGLQGRVGEARTIYASILPKDKVDDNIEYIKSRIGK